MLFIDSFSLSNQGPIFTDDGYLILSAGICIGLDSYPFVTELEPAIFTILETSPGVNADPHYYIPPTRTFPAMAGRGGWNTQFGWDDGAPAMSSTPYMPGMPGMPLGGYAPAAMAPMATMNPMMTTTTYGMPGTYQPAGAPGYPFPQYGQYPVAQYPGNGYYAHYRPPQPHPRVSTEFPGMNIVNSTGGAGCEPGYNYIFHDEHVKIHVLRTKEPPWRAPGLHYPFVKFMVPTNTTIKELFGRLGAFNPDPMLNRITEVREAGSGRWNRGMIFTGDQEADIKQTLKEIGWDGTRNGREKDYVWVWVTSD
ncbi:hypothetical protein RRF57_006012 [Xylaria bambusicola]|uniref:Uncharacterized protein n=1 Tax=Xylaria bambusicola TaxID=326684 RepID=A0AAN7UKJ1_9PEZI